MFRLLFLITLFYSFSFANWNSLNVDIAKEDLEKGRKK
jgi:hypothetical protein